MGLPVTGNVDGVTIKMMRKPRCGVADVEDGAFKTRKKRYSVFGSKWSKTHLTYSPTRPGSAAFNTKPSNRACLAVLE